MMLRLNVPHVPPWQVSLLVRNLEEVVTTKVHTHLGVLPKVKCMFCI